MESLSTLSKLKSSSLSDGPDKCPYGVAPEYRRDKLTPVLCGSALPLTWIHDLPNGDAEHPDVWTCRNWRFCSLKKKMKKKTKIDRERGKIKNSRFLNELKCPSNRSIDHQRTSCKSPMLVDGRISIFAFIFASISMFLQDNRPSITSFSWKYWFLLYKKEKIKITWRAEIMFLIQFWKRASVKSVNRFQWFWKQWS